MPQARGTQMAVNLYEESTYNTDPGSPSATKMYVKSLGLSSSQNLLDSETLNSNRARSRPDQGNVDVAGPTPVEVAAESIGLLLKHAMGSVATHRPVSNQPTNVTGVVVEHAEDTCPTGNGTLAYTNAGTTLSWAANGDTAGAAVDVSAGGEFTLQSTTASQSLTVTVTPGSLPGTDQSDADITVVAAYKHIFTIGDLPTGLVVERDYGSNISGSGRFEKFNGVRVGSVAFDFPQEGYPEAAFDLKGASSTLAASALDGTPDDPGHTSFSSFAVGTIEEGGSTIATVTAAKIALANELDEDGYVLGSGNRAQLPEGFATVTGELTALFTDASILTKAINNTASSFKIDLTRGDGFGTSGNERIEWMVDQLVYERRSPPVEGPGGVKIVAPFKSYRDGTSNGLQVTLYNAVSSYA